MLDPKNTLWLIPTAMERDLFQASWEARYHQPFPGKLRLCGFGPIASAATASKLIEESTEKVCLLGIAGTYDAQQFPVGHAIWFSQVVNESVGCETDDGWHLPSQMGLPQWVDNRPAANPVFESLTLAPASTAQPNRGASHTLLLTVGRAAGSAITTEQRRQRFPGVLGEDMEGFGVALASTIHDRPCLILRGASNLVGDRDHRNWKIADAMTSVADTLYSCLSD